MNDQLTNAATEALDKIGPSVEQALQQTHPAGVIVALVNMLTVVSHGEGVELDNLLAMVTEAYRLDEQMAEGDLPKTIINAEGGSA